MNRTLHEVSVDSSATVTVAARVAESALPVRSPVTSPVKVPVIAVMFAASP